MNHRERILEFSNAARRELQRFRDKPQFSTLSQAAEKCWVMFSLMIEQKSGMKITGKQRPKPIAKRLGYGELYYRCHELHVFHYGGSVASDWDDIAGEISEIIPIILDEVEA